jgi:hypothetical protein
MTVCHDRIAVLEAVRADPAQFLLCVIEIVLKGLGTGSDVFPERFDVVRLVQIARHCPECIRQADRSGSGVVQTL